jgi:hypothetical protein
VARHRRTHRRRWPYALALVVGAYAVVAALLVVHARSELLTAQRLLPLDTSALLSQDPTALDEKVHAAGLHTAKARATADGLWLRPLALIPGSPVKAVRNLAIASDLVVREVAPEALQAKALTNPAALRPEPGTVSIDELNRLQAVVIRAKASAAQARQLAHDAPSTPYLPPLQRARETVVRSTDKVSQLVGRTSSVLELLPRLLGSEGPRRYFVAFQTPVEARGTGGLVGAYAILSADHGRVAIERRGSDEDLPISGEPVIDMGPEYTAAYGRFGATRDFRNANMSPYFPDAAKILAAMWQSTTGQRVDGVIATDPIALSYVLGAVGPTELKETGDSLTKDNVVRLTLSDAYARYPNPKQRKAYLQEVSSAIFDHLLTSSVDRTSQLLSAMTRATTEGRLLMWSSTDDVEAKLAPTRAGGVLPSGKAPFAGVVINNAAGSKLDYYLTTSVKYVGAACTGGRRSTTVTVSLNNAAPDHGLPSYVMTRADTSANKSPGAERLLISLHATQGAQLAGVRVNGQPATAAQHDEGGRPVWMVDTEIPSGTTATLTLTLDEPSARGKAGVWVQPGVHPSTLKVAVPPCKGS